MVALRKQEKDTWYTRAPSCTSLNTSTATTYGVTARQRGHLYIVTRTEFAERGWQTMADFLVGFWKYLRRPAGHVLTAFGDQAPSEIAMPDHSETQSIRSTREGPYQP